MGGDHESIDSFNEESYYGSSHKSQACDREANKYKKPIRQDVDKRTKELLEMLIADFTLPRVMIALVAIFDDIADAEYNRTNYKNMTVLNFMHIANDLYNRGSMILHPMKD